MSEAKTLNNLRRIGIKALADALGPIGMVRFLQSFELGSGDYTKERDRWLVQSIDEITREISKSKV